MSADTSRSEKSSGILWSPQINSPWRTSKRLIESAKSCSIGLLRHRLYLRLRLVGRAVGKKDDVDDGMIEDHVVKPEFTAQQGQDLDLRHQTVDVGIRNFSRPFPAMDGQIANFHLEMEGDDVEASQLDSAAGGSLQRSDQTLTHQSPERVRSAVPPQPNSTSAPASISHSRYFQILRRSGFTPVSLIGSASGAGVNASARISLPARRLCSHAVSSWLIFFWVSSSLIFPVTWARGTLCPGLAKLGQKFLVVIALDALGIYVDRWPQARVHQSHQIQFARHPVPESFFAKPVLVQQSLQPRSVSASGYCLRISATRCATSSGEAWGGSAAGSCSRSNS